MNTRKVNTLANKLIQFGTEGGLYIKKQKKKNFFEKWLKLNEQEIKLLSVRSGRIIRFYEMTSLDKKKIVKMSDKQPTHILMIYMAVKLRKCDTVFS